MKLAQYVGLRSRLRHVSSAPSVVYSTGCYPASGHPSRLTSLDGELTGTCTSPPLGRSYTFHTSQKVKFLARKSALQKIWSKYTNTERFSDERFHNAKLTDRSRKATGPFCVFTFHTSGWGARDRGRRQSMYFLQFNLWQRLV